MIFIFIRSKIIKYSGTSLFGVKQNKKNISIGLLKH